MGMVLLSFTRDDRISDKIGFYAVGLVIIQLVVIIITFEFMRKPWDGTEIELEKVLTLQQNKVLEDSISEITNSLPNNFVNEKI